MSVLVWVMVGIAIWHFTVLVPDKFTGGIVGAFLAAVAGALVTGYLLPTPGLPVENPPGLTEGLWPIPGALVALALLYAHGARRDPDAAAASSPRAEVRDFTNAQRRGR
jgi:uncharacterized membrane protein YeaQ/YmgE (transglycosylase-associated protein family)